MKKQVFKFNSRQIHDLNMIIETISSNRSVLLSKSLNFEDLTMTIDDDNLKFLVSVISESTERRSHIDGRLLYDDILDVFTKQDGHNVIQPIIPQGIELPII
jgi:hypothetical protein